MGVTGLWQVLMPVKKDVKLHDLHGQKLAIDLSIWIYESLALKEPETKWFHTR